MGRGRGGVESLSAEPEQAEGEATPTPPSPRGEESCAEDGPENEEPSVVTFAASAPNGAGVVTELLAQPLASRHRRAYLDKYRHQTFIAFAPGHLSAEVPLAPGWVALACRFVEAATGQATGLVELGVLQVG